MTYGGYSSGIVVDQDFVLRVPGRLDPAGAAPLLCAGITTYSPLRHWDAGPGSRSASSGSAAWATWASSWPMRSARRWCCSPVRRGRADDAKRLGADRGGACLATPRSGEACGKPGPHPRHRVGVARHQPLPQPAQAGRHDGLLGVPEHPHPSTERVPLIFKRRQLAGSLIGGIRETQEMLDFCAEHASCRTSR